jgi:hypothetical protein
LARKTSRQWPFQRCFHRLCLEGSLQRTQGDVWSKSMGSSGLQCTLHRSHCLAKNCNWGYARGQDTWPKLPSHRRCLGASLVQCKTLERCGGSRLSLCLGCIWSR